MFGPKKDASLLRGIRVGIGIFCQVLMQRFAIFAAIMNAKLEETFEECVVNQFLQPMAIAIGRMLLK